MKTAKEILTMDDACFPDGYAGALVGYDSAILKMEEYADQFKPKWISVEDGLPEEEGDYLVTDGDAQFVSNYENSKWYFFGVEFWSGDEVTHWMPLPNPPEQ